MNKIIYLKKGKEITITDSDAYNLIIHIKQGYKGIFIGKETVVRVSQIVAIV